MDLTTNSLLANLAARLFEIQAMAFFLPEFVVVFLLSVACCGFLMDFRHVKRRLDGNAKNN